jgi:hypothetical protein
MDSNSQPQHDSKTDGRAVGILARSLFRQMRDQGFTPEQMIALSSELIQLVREDLQRGLAAE